MREEYQLDAVDQRIVRALQRDASLSHAALAETVGASAASVWRRVRNLEKEGVLGASVRLADPGRLGRSVNVLCQVRMTRQTMDARAEFETFIEGREAQSGIIRPLLDPATRPLWPEAFWLLQHKTRLSYTLEAPSDFPLQTRVNALVEGVKAALA